MGLLRDTSISRKLKVIILATTSVALLIASAAIVTYDLVAFRQSMASDLSTLAKVIGTNSTAALTFNDRESATDVLAALTAKRNIVRARIYKSNSDLFAEYVRDGESGDLALTVQQDSHVAFTGSYLIASELIRLDGENIGTVYLISNLDPYLSRLNRYAGVVAAVILGTLLVAFVLSSKLQTVISAPISHLAQTARAVSIDKDYTIRAVKHGCDEMGMLIDGFNEMLSQIQERDARLQRARDELEQRVEDRTKEIQDEIAQRKRIEDALRHSEEHFRSLIEDASDIITILDIDGTIRYESPSIERLLGYTPEELIGKNAIEFIHPDDAPSALALLGADGSESPGSTRSVEFRFKHRSDGWRTLEAVGRICRDQSGVDQAIINSRDITERKRAEDNLRESEEVFRSLAESVSAAIYIYRDFKYIYLNPAAEAISGYSRDELMGMEVWDVVHPDFLEPMKERASLRQKGEDVPARSEIKIRTKSGEPRWLDLTASLIRFQGEPAVLATAFDITERRGWEDALRESEEKYRTILQSIQEGYYEVDLRGHLTFFNDSLARIVGTPAEKLMGLSHREYTDPETARMVFEAFNRVYITGEPLEGLQYEITTLEGRKSFNETSVSLRRDSTGKIVGFRGTIRDITERKRAEEAVIESEKRYRALFESNPQPMWVFSTETLAFLAVNDAAVDSYGYSQEEFLAMSLKDIRPPEDVQTFLQILENADPGYEKSGGVRHRKKDGSIIDVDVSSHGLYFGGNKARLVLATDVTERKRATKELQDSELKYRTLFNHIADPVFIFDKKNRQFRDCNEAVQQNYGYSIEELQTMSVFDLHPPEEIARVEHHRHDRNTDHPKTYTHIKKDGSRIDVEILTKEIEYNGGPCWISIVRDITDRKRAEAEIILQKTRFQQLMENSPVGIVMLDQDDKVLRVNQAFENIFQFSTDELIGRSISQAIVPDTWNEEAAALYATTSQGLTVEKQTVRRRKDGSLVDVQIFGVPVVVDKKAMGVYWLYVDITENKLAQKALQESEAHFRALIENAQDLIIVIDKDLRVIYESPSVEKALGFKAEDRIGNSALEIIHPDDIPAISELFQQGVPRPGFRASQEFRARHKDGSWRILEGIGQNLLSDPAVRGIVVNCRDVTERRKIENEVMMLAHAIRSIYECVSITDPDDNILFVNEAFLETYGYTNDETIGKNIRHLTRRDNDSEGEEVPSPHAIATRRWEGELINRRKDGTEFPLQLSASPIHDENGRTIALVGIGQDITERKRVEQTLRESELRYKTLFDAASDSIMILDTEGDRIGQIIAANRSASQMTGYRTDELLNLNVADLRTSEHAAQVRRDVERVLTGESVTIELSRRRKDGVTFPVEVNQSVLPLGDKHYVLDFARDISQRKKIEKEVAMLAQAIRSIHEAVVVTDANANIIFVNNAAVNMFGYEVNEVIGHSVTILHATHDSAFIDEILGSWKSGSWEGETLSQRRDGTKFPMYLSASEIHGDDGQFIAFIGVCQDITEQKRSIEDLQRAKEAAEAASRAKSEFLANMSHEIRTPMNGIVGMTELALDTELTSEQREYLKLVKLSSDSLLRVINDILDFSKIEAGKLELELAEFGLQDTIDEVMKALVVRADQMGLELAYYLRPGVPERVVGDVGRLRQILVNLVGNAIKFTEQGEVVVRIDLESRTDDQVVLHFCVRDTGIGIPIDKQAVIFDSFTQADGSTTRKYGGTGLGLTISSQLVRLMNGQIWVESPAKCESLETDNRSESSQLDVQARGGDPKAAVGGPGSMLHFTAAFGWAPTSQEPTTPLELSTLLGLPVLVVDDNATNRRILEVQLTGWGMKPVTTSNAAQALDAIRNAAASTEPFGLVLVDLHMPDVDGAELTALIRRMPEAADVKIIMMSSGLHENYGTPDFAIDAYLMKPVKASQLLGVIRAVLGKQNVPQNGSQHPRHIASTHPARVLLAEDGAVNQELIKQLLTKWGHSVVIANNGKHALSLLEGGSFDVVLMDVQMPELNGFEATAAIRSKERGTDAHMPIIALTAHALKGDREKCIAAGMDDYISKPVDADKLFAAIEAAIAGTQRTNGNGREPNRALDAKALMLSLDGDVELLRSLASIFTTAAPAHLSEIETAIASQNAEALMRSAHTLKGSVAVFQAPAAVEAAAVLEQIGRSGDLSNANPGFETLNQEIAQLTRQIQELTKELR